MKRQDKPTVPAASTAPVGPALIESAQARWRAVNAPHLVALVRAGATFLGGKLVERPEETPATEETTTAA